MAGEYLITAINGMYALLWASTEPQPRQLAGAASLGCHALRLLAEDSAFYERLHILAVHQRMLLPAESEFQLSSVLPVTQASSARSTMYGAFGTEAVALAFERASRAAGDRQEQTSEALLAFLRAEEELLLACGMRPEVVADLLEPFHRNPNGTDLRFVNPNEMEAAVARLRDAACRTAYELDVQVRNRGNLGRIMHGLGGAALIMADVSSWTISMGMTLPMTALSGALGGALISNAIGPGQDG